MTSSDDLPLPLGTVLLHIGPQKTGTSGLQGAFHGARRRLEGQGVHYAGAGRQSRKAAIAAASGEDSERATSRAARDRHWQALLGDVEHATAARVVVSSEDFADAEPEAIQRIVRDLGAERVHIVVTLRPLDRILPSQWQQLVQGGATTSYEDWLENVLDKPTSGDARLFWHRHRHDELIARWGAIVGTDNVTAVVVDDRRPEAVLRAFEHLLGVRETTLRPVLEGANRSLTRAEIELVRAAHAAFRAAEIPTRLRLDVVARGMAASAKLREPAREEQRVATPSSLLERVRTVSVDVVDGIRELGVRVLGDLSSLQAQPAAAQAADAATTVAAWPAIQRLAVSGALQQTGLTRGTARPAPKLADWSTTRIASHVVGRLKGLARTP